MNELSGTKSAEDEVMIAKFMGAVKSKFDNDSRYLRFTEKTHGSYAFYPWQLRYKKSWDWLMPACKKFDQLNLFDKVYERLCDEIDNAVSCYEIKPVFKNLVKAIKWYNNQNKK